MSEEQKTPQSNFANWFTIELAKRPGLTAGQLAQRAGISRDAAYKYLNDDRVPTPEQTVKIAEALGVNPNRLPVFTKKKQLNKEK